MASKKLLAASLCLALLLVPIVFIFSEDPSSHPEPFFDNGLYHDPMIPEIVIPPDTCPNVTVTQTATSAGVSEEPATITVNVLLGLEEDYLPCGYYTPKGHLNGFLYALLQVERASYHFEQVFDTRLEVRGWVSWHSDEEGAGQKADENRFYEMIDETGFYRGMTYEGYEIEMMIAWTLDLTAYLGLAHHDLGACMVNYVAYWADDNIVQHEVSHLLGAEDGTYERWYVGEHLCWQENCVMSNRYKSVKTLEEDGVVFNVNADVPVALLYNDWCTECYGVISVERWYYWDNPEQNPHPMRCGDP